MSNGRAGISRASERVALACRALSAAAADLDVAHSEQLARLAEQLGALALSR
jgi:hypothetical protein